MIEQIEKILISKATKRQQTFSGSLIPNALPILGVKTPEIRLLAKQIIKGDFRLFLNKCEPKTFEMQLLKGYVIAEAKMDINEKLNYLDQFIPTITDWAVNDGLSSALKCCKKYSKEMFNYLLKYKNSKKEFEVRFVSVMLMSYYLNDDYIDIVFSILDDLYLNDYYAKMGVAWCISTAMAKHPYKTKKYFGNNNLDSWTINKSISKCRDSLVVSKSDKNYILRFKK